MEIGLIYLVMKIKVLELPAVLSMSYTSLIYSIKNIYRHVIE